MKSCDLQIWDAGGRERNFRCLSQGFFGAVDACIVVVDVAVSPVQRLQFWLDELKACSVFVPLSCFIHFLLAGGTLLISEG